MSSLLFRAFLFLAFLTASAHAAPDVYVDAAGDFTPANPDIGDPVTWNGTGGAVNGLTFGTDAFASVKDGIDAVDVDGTVHIAAGEYFKGSSIEVGKTLTLLGDGADLTALLRDDTDGDASTNKHSVVEITGSATVATVEDLRISGGRVSTTRSGGGIDCQFTELILNRCGVNGNTAQTIYSGGGIGGDEPTITVSNSTVSGNTAEHNTSGGGIGGSNPTITVSNSTVSGNTADGVHSGGGIGGLRPTITMTNSTVSDNTAEGAFSSGGIGGSFPVITLGNAMVVGNSNGDAFLNSEIVAIFTDEGGNLVAVPEGLSISDIISPLADNGGPTLTHALVAGSPAIDGGLDANIPAGVTTDQRGSGFPRNNNARVDIGAYESPSSVYVDATGDFTPANPDIGDQVTWNGTGGAVNGLTFGTDAFASVQDGIDAVDVGGVVHIAAGEYFKGSRIEIGKTLTLLGDGADLTALLRDDTDGDASTNKHSVVRISGNGTVATVEDIRISGGRTSATFSGGGIECQSAEVTVIACEIDGNTVEGSNSGGGIGGRDSTITVSNSTVSGNTAESFNSGGGIGGFDPTITVSSSTVSGNSVEGSNSGGGIGGSNPTITVSSSTVSGNSVEGSNSGGGIGGVYPTITVTNSTVEGNTVEGFNSGGGIGGFDPTITVSNSTVSGNTATGINSFGGIEIDDQPVTLGNTLIAGNTGSDAASNEIDTNSADFMDNGGNLLAIPSGLSITDILAPLADNGGVTLTHALVAGSPAIDGGLDANIPAGATTDQRGTGFPRNNNARVDTGAFESLDLPGRMQLVSTDPTDGSSGAALDGTISFTFDTAVEAGTGNIVIRDDDGNLIEEIDVTSGAVSFSGMTVTVTPSADLPAGTQITFEIANGVIVGTDGSVYSLAAGDVTFTSEVSLTDIYVDAAGDFTPANPAPGDTVTWNGTGGAVAGLTFGTNAFSSVQDGIDAVDSDGTVHIAAGEYFKGSRIEIGKTLTLLGDGADLTALLRDDTDGDASANKHSVVRISGSGTVATVEDLRISGGRTSALFSGGGIDCQNAELIVIGCEIDGNTSEASSSGGGIGGSGGLTITVSNSAVSGNTAEGSFSGGGIGGNNPTITLSNCMVSGNTTERSSSGGGVGGNRPTITVSNSTVSGNTAEGTSSGGGIGGSGGPTITVSNSTVSANTAGGSGSGGGIGGADPTITVNNSTVSGNTAEGTSSGGGIGGNSPTITITNGTVSGNTATNPGSFGGIRIDDGSVTSGNTLIAGNTGSDTASNEFSANSAFTDNGGNLLAIPSGLTIADILAPLADNGGSTLTHALVAGSPAIDGGLDANIPAGATTDQRGTGFPRNNNARVDIGAVESLDLPLLFRVVSTSPENASTGVERDSDISFGFNRAVQAGTGNILIFDSTGNMLESIDVTSGAVSFSGRTVTVNPAADLPEGRDVTFEFASGVLLGADGETTSLAANTVNLRTCWDLVRVANPAGFTITTDTGAAGLSDGDTVTWDATSETVPGMVFGSNAFTSVQDAVDAVCADGTVRIAAGNYTEGAEVLVEKGMTITGDGSALTVLDGALSHQVMLIRAAGESVFVNRIAITGGGAIDSAVFGGIDAECTLSVSECAFTNNTGGLVSKGETMSVFDSVFSGNQGMVTLIANTTGLAQIVGCRIKDNGTNGAFGTGAVFINRGSIEIRNSEISGNTGDGQIGAGGIFINGPVTSARIDSCLIAGNEFISGEGNGGAGGIETRAPLHLINTTISGNTSFVEGSTLRTGGLLVSIFPVEVIVENCTITGNVGESGGGIGAFALSGSADRPPTVILRNSVVAGNSAVEYPDLSKNLSSTLAENPTLADAEIKGEFRVSGKTFVGDTDGSGLSDGPDLLTFSSTGSTLEQLLGSLTDSGGSSSTHALPGGSPATDAGDATVLSADAADLDDDGNITEPIPFDQRGAGFPRVSGDNIDLGAFENQNAPPVIVLNGDNPATVECAVGSFMETATASDPEDGDVTDDIVVGGDAVVSGTLGTYVLTYDVTDSGGLAAPRLTRTVNVVDTTAPVIALNGAAAFAQEAGTAFSDPGTTLTEACDATAAVIVDGDTVDVEAPGVYTLIYDATDSSGNMAAQVTREVTVADTIAPVITLVGDAEITLTANVDSYTEQGATAADSFDTDVPVTTGGDTVDTTTVGIYTVTYDAQDDAGNNATQVTRTVNVVESPSYALGISIASQLEGDSGATDFVFTVTRSGASTGTGSVDWEVVPAGDVTADDFTGALSGTVNFGGGSSSENFTVQVSGDPDEEPDETFAATISNPLPSGTQITTASANATILSDDFLAVYVDAAGDFTPANPAPGDTVTWNGTGGSVAGLVFGTNAFASVTDATGAVQAEGTVFIADGVYDEGAEIVLDRNITLKGDGRDLTILSGGSDASVGGMEEGLTDDTALNPADPHGVLVVNENIVAEISDMTVRNGTADNGAGVRILQDADVSLRNTYFQGNSAPFSGGAVQSRGTLLVRDSVFDRNSSGSFGGALNIRSGSAVIVGSGFFGNRARDGGALENGAPVTIINSTFSGNFADGDGGSIYNEDDMELINVTVSGNTASADGGGIFDDNEIILTNCLIAGNTAGGRGDEIDGSDVEVRGNIFIGSLGFSDISAGPGVLTFDSTGTTLPEVLSPLADNGGATLSHAPVATGPAVNSGANSEIPADTADVDGDGNLTEPLPFDQRGEGFQRVFDSIIDLGAIEVQNTEPTITLVGGDFTTDLGNAIECAGPAFADPGATASDAQDGDISGDIIVSGSVDTTTPGTYVLSYNVSDSTGRTAETRTRTVQVVDTTAPVVSLIGSANIALNVGDTYTESGATASDTCDQSLPAVTIDSSAVDTSQPGSYQVTYNVSDSSGNTATQVIRTVTVSDAGAPVITLTGANPQFIECPSAYTELGATASDDVDGNLTDEITINSTAVNTTVPGTYPVTYNVSDNAGNAAVQVTRTVTVRDTTAPVITLTGNATVALNVGDTYIESGATASDTCDQSLPAVTIDSSAVDTTQPGSYQVTYNVSDASGNAASQVIRTVTVSDAGAPVITLVGANPKFIECPAAYTELGATATDDVDGDLSTDIVIDASAVDTTIPGSYDVTYNVSDTAGNSAQQVTRTVTVRDTTAPVITLTGNATVALNVGDTYTEAGAAATDTCDQSLPAVTIDSSAVDTSQPGSYQVTYNISDSSGNTASQVIRTVTVSDAGAPVITLVGANPQFIECPSAYTEFGATATDDVDGNLTTDIMIDATAVDTSAPGTYSVTYNVSDEAGNAAVQVTRTVTVRDTTAPVINLNGSANIALNVGDTYTEAGATASDTCDQSLPTVTIDSSAVDTSQPGSYQVTYNVSDSSGNAATQVIRTVTVSDAGAPVITLVGANPQFIECPAAYNELGATASDDVDGDLTADIVIDATAVDTSTPGDYPVTYNVSDEAGNAAVQVTRTVTVRDTTAPVIVLSGSANVMVPFASTYTDAGATVSDSCDSTVALVTANPVDTNTPGTYTVRFNAIDASGNNATEVTRSVTVAEPSRYSIQATVATAPEGNDADTLLTFTVTRTGTEFEGAVDWAAILTDGLNADDLRPTGGKISFAAGQAIGTISVTAIGDRTTENDETLVIRISNPEPATGIIATGNAQTVITNDDSTPVSTADGPYTVVEDGTLSVTAANGVLANDSDADPDQSLTASTVATTANGQLTLMPDGSFTYQPNADFFGADGFTYRATDGVNSSEASVTITVTTEVNIAVDVVRLPGAVTAGGHPTAAFRVDLRNDGPSAATGIEISQTSVLPAGVSVSGAIPSTGGYANGIWTLALAENGTASLTVFLQAGQDAQPGNIGYAVTLSGSNETDGNPANNLDSDTTTVVGGSNPELVVKVGRPSTARPACLPVLWK